MPTPAPPQLPDDVRKALDTFVAAAQAAFGADLVSMVLFGTAAEGRLRATSDVNVIVVTKRFDPAQASALREAYRTAHAAIDLNAMFLAQSEIPGVSHAFAEKFADITTRHYVLFGSDPFTTLDLPPRAVYLRLAQILANLTLRLRERYMLMSLREEQLTPVIADAAAPLRTSAATLLRLEGTPSDSPKAALQTFVQRHDQQGWRAAIDAMSRAREGEELAPGEGLRTTAALMAIAERLLQTAESGARGSGA